ncbi:MAG: class I SAM-dependent DNA methyltransferase, partial [Micrococcales bacterium]|nr:class I SAM-dependent DNA methyltransferase [Micrococcales bacterium]
MVKPLALNEIRRRAAQFVLDWQDSPGDERQDGQSFVRDLLQVYGITGTRAALFEHRAKRVSTGHQGFIDALIPPLPPRPGVAVEMKSAGKDLAKAEQQALDYLDSLPDAEMPQFVLTCDFQWFRLLDVELAEGPDSVIEFPLADFPKQADRLAFLAGYGIESPTAAEQEAASVKAARLMGSLFEAMEHGGYTEQETSVFLVRTLFCLYADSAGVWPRDLFTRFVEQRTREDGSDLGGQLALLYQVLGKPFEVRQQRLDEMIACFPYINGGIFAQRLEVPAFDQVMRERLLECCHFDWSVISPAVFGSMFQAVKSKQARRQLGEHYTTEKNIMRLIGPMFLDGLRQRLDQSRSDPAKLRALRRDLGLMRFLDPACGCGNFLVVAYREMRALELAILVRLQELQAVGEGGQRKGTTFTPTLMFDAADLAVRLEHFQGIEIDEWPAQIAATALHLVDHQANLAMELALGQGPETLPLTKDVQIHVGNALRMDWAEVVGPTDRLYILGNPPFMGHATRNSTQAQELRDVWNRNDIGRLDYVTGWYAKALDLFKRPDYSGEFAFVSTNSITQGEPVPALFSPVFGAGWRIKFAHRTFAWTSEAP